MLSQAETLRACALGLAMLAGGAAALGASGANSPAKPWPALLNYRARVARDLGFLRARMSTSQVVTAQIFGASVVVVAAVASWTPWPLVTLPLIAWGPAAVIDNLVSRRRLRIEGQLDGWLVSLANSLHATPSLGAGLETSSQTVGGPMAEEIDLVLKQHRLGSALERGLGEMEQRVGSRALAGAVLLLQLALRTGGNLPSTLQATAATLREIARLEGVVRTKTAEGRGQTRLIGMLPLPLLSCVYLMDANFLAPLWTSTRGHMVVAAAVGLWVLAIASAHQIMQVEV